VVEIKAFIPAKNFALSMEFYEALGFTRASVFEDIAYFHCGDSSFLLLDFFVQEHTANYQMHLLVENVDAWHEKAKAVAERFNVKIGEPENRPWANARLHSVRSKRCLVAHCTKHSEAGEELSIRTATPNSSIEG
jgi:hypothetical protein